MFLDFTQHGVHKERLKINSYCVNKHNYCIPCYISRMVLWYWNVGCSWSGLVTVPPDPGAPFLSLSIMWPVLWPGVDWSLVPVVTRWSRYPVSTAPLSSTSAVITASHMLTLQTKIIFAEIWHFVGKTTHQIASIM